MPFDYTDSASAVTMRWLRAAMIDTFGEDVSDRLPAYDFDSDAIVSPKLLDIIVKKWDVLATKPTGEKIFTPGGLNTITVPSRVRKLTLDAVGGGGGGGSGSYGGGGSSGAGVSSLALDVTPGSLLTIDVGSGGAIGTAGGDTSISIKPSVGDAQILTYLGGRAGSSTGSAGASSGDGSSAGSAGGSRQTQTGGGYYNNSVGSSVAQYSTLNQAKSAYPNCTTSRPATQTSSKPSNYLIESGTITLSGYALGALVGEKSNNKSASLSQSQAASLFYPNYSSLSATSKTRANGYYLIYTGKSAPPASWLANQTTSGYRYVVYVYLKEQKYEDLGGNDGDKLVSYYNAVCYNISPRTSSGYIVYPINSTYVSPTYRTDYYKGSGGASVISGYGKGGDGGQAGQNGHVRIRW